MIKKKREKCLWRKRNLRRTVGKERGGGWGEGGMKEEVYSLAGKSEKVMETNVEEEEIDWNKGKVEGK